MGQGVRHQAFVLSAVVALLWPHVSLAISPDALAEYERGLKSETQKDYNAAEEAYRKSIALDAYDSLAFIRLGGMLAEKGRVDEAIQLYQKALEITPGDVMIHQALAPLYEAKNQPEKAIAEYSQALAANPSYAYAHLSMAHLEKSLNHPEEAIKHYEAFLKAYPSHVDAQRELAAMHLSQNQFEQAASTYQHLKTQQLGQFKDDLALGVSLNQADKPQEALAVFEKVTTPSVILYEQKAIAYEKLNKLPEAYNNYKKAIDLAPKEKNELYLKLADLSESMNKPSQSEESLKAYLKYHPDNLKVVKSLGDMALSRKDYAGAQSFYEEALNKSSAKDKDFQVKILRQLGYVYQMQGRLDTAQQTYEKAQTLADDKQTRLNLALIYHQQKKYQEAVDLYRKLLVENPNSQSIRKDMGQALLALGDEAARNKDYNKALAIYQDAYLLGSAPEAPVLLGMANAHYELKNYPMAYTTYQRVLEKDPENPVARVNKAQLDLDQKNYMGALESLRAVVEKHPDNLDAYRLLAYTHAQLSDYGNAILNYKKALEIQPNDPTMLTAYGNAWREVGDLNRAEEAYKLAKNQTPDDPLIHYNLASVYNLENKLDDSISAYQKAIELNPEFVESYYGLGTTWEKKQKTTEALNSYETFLQKAPPNSVYIPYAKSRVDYLKKAMAPKSSAPLSKPAATKPAASKPATSTTPPAKPATSAKPAEKPATKPATTSTVKPAASKPAAVITKPAATKPAATTSKPASTSTAKPASKPATKKP